MKCASYARDSLGGLLHGRAHVAVAFFCALALLPLRSAGATKTSESDDIFQSAELLRVSIEIPSEGVEMLRRSRSSSNHRIKPEALATVYEGGRTYKNVAVQLKGYTTFRPIDDSPSLTLKFDKHNPGQEFHGLTKISLNNSLQDSTRLHEKLARALFAAAGVPVPRSDHALVTLNGRSLGLYVLTEGYNKEFLHRHFPRANGHLYEGGVLQDIDRPLEVDSGQNAEKDDSVRRLIIASREPDPSDRFQALAKILDLDRFLSMTAMEAILCHSDSYSMNRNNYRVYHDPRTDQLVFMPHGMDRILGTHRSSLDLDIVPPLMGLVARALLTTPEGRRRHVERLGVLVTNVFRPAELCRRVHEIDAKIIAAKVNPTMDDPSPTLARVSSRHTRDVERLCARISERAAELEAQLAHQEDYLTLTPTPAFNANGIAFLSNWKPKPRAERSEVESETVQRDDAFVFHLKTGKAPLVATLRSQVSLPPGNYRLRGSISAGNPGDPANTLAAALVRYSTSRFGARVQRFDPRAIDVAFHVSAAQSPEELEFVCDIQDDASEVWFDVSALRLMREDSRSRTR